MELRDIALSPGLSRIRDRVVDTDDLVKRRGHEVLTVKTAAARACVSATLVYQWCADGTLAHLRVGGKGRRGKILIREEDLDDLLNSFRVEGRATKSPAPRPRNIKLQHLKMPSRGSS